MLTLPFSTSHPEALSHHTQLSLAHAVRSGLLSLALMSAGSLPEQVLAEKSDSAKVGRETEQLLVYLRDGQEPSDFAKRYDLKQVRSLLSDVNAHVFSADSVELAQRLLGKIQDDDAVVAAFNNREVWVEVAADPFVPNDPYHGQLYHPPYSFDGSWHLREELGIDALTAWSYGVTGAGVTIGIADSGLDMDHPDLAIDSTLSHDFVGDDDDPSANVFAGASITGRQAYSHGTSVAGVAAAVGGNKTGTAGVAPSAHVAALRLPLWGSYENDENYQLADPTYREDLFVDVLHFGGEDIAIKNHSYIDGALYADRTARAYALAESTAAGTIHIFGAGNGRVIDDIHYRADTNAATHNTPEAIVVGAIGPDGRYAAYSNYGTSMLITAPSSTWWLPSGQVNDTQGFAMQSIEGRSAGLLTTDIQGSHFGMNAPDNCYSLCDQMAHFPDTDYREDFGGTSAAAPVISGLLALAKEVRPELTTRFAKHLLVNSSRVVDSDDMTDSSAGGWQYNAAGCRFNSNYGFGVPNAGLLIKLASDPELTLSKLTKTNSRRQYEQSPIPDGDLSGLSYTAPFPGSSQTPLEEVGVSLWLTHAQRTQLEIELISPAGTSSRLLTAMPHALDTSEDQSFKWTFWTHAFWGENPNGDWTLVVRDTQAKRTGLLTGYQLHWRQGALQRTVARHTEPVEVCESQ